MKKMMAIGFLFISLGGIAQKQTLQHNNKVKCPVCKKHTNVVPIIYGRPGKVLQEKAERGEVKLGGCVISEKAPHHYCIKDKKEF